MRSINKSEISWSSWDNGLLFECISWHQSNGMVPSSASCWHGNIWPYDQCYLSPDIPHSPCLSNKSVNKFLSFASPLSSVNRCASSCSTTCTAIIAAAATSCTTSNDASVSTTMRVCFKHGSSSLRTSAGRCSSNLASAMRPNAYKLAFVSSRHDGRIGLAWKETRAAWRVVKP